MGAPRKYHTDEERKAAKREKDAAWRRDNPERYAELQALNRERNRERRRRQSAEWYASHPGYHSARRAEDPSRARVATAAWRAAHPERARAMNVTQKSARRARLVGGEPDLTVEQWQEILEEFGWACAYCQARGVKLEQEHMTPLSRGGRHTRSNVVPACRSCNARKYTKTLFEFAAMG